MPSPRGRRPPPHEPSLELAVETEASIDDTEAREQRVLEEDDAAAQDDYDAIDELPADDVQNAIENDEPAVPSDASSTTARRREHEPPSDVCMQCGSTSFRETDCPHDEVAHIERTDRKTQDAISALQATWQARRRAERVLRRQVEGKAADGEASIEHTPSTAPVRERDLDVDLIARLTPSVPIVMTPLPSSTRRRRKSAPDEQVMFAFATPAPAPVEQVEPSEPSELPRVATASEEPITPETKPATRGRKRGTVRPTDERPGD
jgi:hypothetical protein